MLKLYLDNCVFNRPFDDQSQIRIKTLLLREPFDYTKWQCEVAWLKNPNSMF